MSGNNDRTQTAGVMEVSIVWEGFSQPHVFCNLKKRKDNNTHPKSQQQKVSVLRTHLYPSRLKNPVRLWMKPQLQLRGNGHLKRTIIVIIPNMQLWVPSCCHEAKQTVKDFGRKRQKEKEIGSRSVIPVWWSRPLLCRQESELRTTHTVLHPLWEEEEEGEEWEEGEEEDHDRVPSKHWYWITFSE